MRESGDEFERSGERVDRDACWRERDAWGTVGESLRMHCEGGVERGLASGSELRDATVEHIRRREEREAGVVMVLAVPGEEALEPGARVKKALEAARVVGLVLESLEVAR